MSKKNSIFAKKEIMKDVLKSTSQEYECDLGEMAKGIIGSVTNPDILNSQSSGGDFGVIREAIDEWRKLAVTENIGGLYEDSGIEDYE